jgi:hypothetical protein
MNDPEDAWYIAQLLSHADFSVVPEFSKDMRLLGLLNVRLTAQDFESILAVY